MVYHSSGVFLESPFGKRIDAKNLPRQCLIDILKLFPKVCLCEPPAKPKMCVITEQAMKDHPGPDAIAGFFRDNGFAASVDVVHGNLWLMGEGNCRVHYFHNRADRQHVYSMDAVHRYRWCPQNPHVGFDERDQALVAMG